MRLPRADEPCWSGSEHVWLGEPDGVRVCQVCGAVLARVREAAP